MTAATPHEVFHTAQLAMVRGDWEAFFPCLAKKALERIAAMVMPMVGDDRAGRFADLCHRQGVPHHLLDAVLRAGDDVRVSAERYVPADPMPPAEMSAWSSRHRDLVKAHDAACAACIKAIPDLAGFVAAVERLRRDTSGGGSISSTMFVDETLTDVVVSGNKGTGVRVFARGSSDPVAFVRERGEWRIQIFAQV